MLDPHGAIGYKALSDYLTGHPAESGIFLETAHPVKFPEVVEESTGKKIEIPLSVQPLLTRKKSSLIMEAGFESLKDWLMQR
jgi:threonine synthase